MNGFFKWLEDNLLKICWVVGTSSVILLLVSIWAESLKLALTAGVLLMVALLVPVDW